MCGLSSSKSVSKMQGELLWLNSTDYLHGAPAVRGVIPAVVGVEKTSDGSRLPSAFSCPYTINNK